MKPPIEMSRVTDDYEAEKLLKSLRRGRHGALAAVAISGALAGAATGALAGPVGAIAGGIIGLLVGGITGEVLDEEAARFARHDRELDAALATNGRRRAPPPIPRRAPPRGAHAH